MHNRRLHDARLNPVVVAALVLALLLHAVLLWWLLRPAMAVARLSTNRTTDSLQRLQLRFLPRRTPSRLRQASQTIATATRPLNPRHQLPASTITHAPFTRPKSTSPMTVTSASTVPLFNADGSIRMPGEALKLRAADAVDMRHFQQLPCHGTRFSDKWTRGQDENLGNEVARKYLSWIGLYNPETEKSYQQRRAVLDQACAH